MEVVESVNTFFSWKPITPSDVLVLIAIVVALFGERVWRWKDSNRSRKLIRQVLIQNLENLKNDLIRIRDERMSKESLLPDTVKNQMSETSIGEISHYYHLFLDLVVPNLSDLNFPNDSKTIDFFDHYKKNIDVLERKKSLKIDTIDKLIEKIELANGELKGQRVTNA